MNVHDLPFRHAVFDDFFEVGEWDIPPATDSIWEARYENDIEYGKRTTRRLPLWAFDVLTTITNTAALKQMDQAFGGDFVADPYMWGGGLQVSRGGGWLNPHLDGTLHPEMPDARRAIQLVCFCHQKWDEKWGGELSFYLPNGNKSISYAPLPGRLIAFENSDVSYHGVDKTRREAEDRVSLSISLLAPRRASDTRVKAMFWPTRK